MYTAAECAHSGDPTFFTNQVLGGLDARFFIHIKGAESKQTRTHNGQANDVAVWPRDLCGELGKRQFRNIELTIGRESCKTLVMT